jgi:hypothetical protein
MSMKFAECVMAVGIAAFAGTGCKITDSDSVSNTGGAAEHGGSPDEKDDSKRGAIERKFKIAEMRLHHANMELASEEMNSEVSVDLAHAELGVVKAKQAQFQSLDMPNRIARAELSLRSAQDRATEAQEELEQLKIMYDEQDLQDMTAEFVINRGKRQAERAQASLAIQKLEFEALQKHEVPRELRGLELEVTRKESSARRAQSDAEANLLQKRIAIMRVEGELVDLKEELAKLEEEGEHE